MHNFAHEQDNSKSLEQLEDERYYYNLNLANSNFSNIDFSPLTISNKIIGVSCSLRYIFYQCDLSNANFSHGKNLQEVIFSECVIEDTNFKFTDVLYWQFLDCTGKAKFNNTDMNQIIAKQKAKIIKNENQSKKDKSPGWIASLLGEDFHIKDRHDIYILNKILRKDVNYSKQNLEEPTIEIEK